MKPHVLSEMATMQRVAETGCNLSRYGYCEFKLMHGRSGLAQAPDRHLQRRLRQVIASQDAGVLVCIPRVYEAMPEGKAKYYEWITKPEVYGPLEMSGKTFGSTFVSRRDGWVDTDDDVYWPLVRGIWQSRPVLLIAGSGKGKRAGGEFLANAASVEHLDAPQRDAWADYDAILSDVLAWAKPKKRPLVYAALGATAAVLCAELASHRVQALDCGHMFQSWKGNPKEMAA